MDVFKKILSVFICLIILLLPSYHCRADDTQNNNFSDSLPIQQQLDALYFHVGYLKIYTKTFQKFDMTAFDKENITNMRQWRQSLFTYIKNLTPVQQAPFFCCVYHYINPQSNIIACAPPTAITSFRMEFIDNLTGDKTMSNIIRVSLTYSNIRRARLFI